MLAEALKAEVDAYVARFADQRDETGRRLVVRNGSHTPREVLTSAGAVEVTAPRVNDKRVDPDTGQRQRFSSAILPPWARKTPKITEVLPLLYLHGLSSGDFVPALGQFLGSAKGLSSAVITKLTEQWKTEQRTFSQRDLSEVDFVYLWADGIHVNIRLEEHKLCLLVMIGVRADGRKEPSRWPMATAKPRNRGRICCGTANDAGCAPPCSPSATAHSALGRATRGIPRDTRAALLVPQDRQRARRAAQVRASRREESPGRDLERRGQTTRSGRREGLRRRLRSQVSEGGRQDHQRPRRAAGVLRLPRPALDPPAHHQPDRVDLRHRPAPSARHQRPRLPRRRHRDGLQAHRVRSSQVARRQRTPPRRTGPRQRNLREGQAGRTRR